MHWGLKQLSIGKESRYLNWEFPLNLILQTSGALDGSGTCFPKSGLRTFCLCGELLRAAIAAITMETEISVNAPPARKHGGESASAHE